MSVAIVICATVLALAGLVFAGWLRWLATTAHERFDPSPVTVDRLVREQVVVTLKTGESFGGVLFEHTDRDLVLRKAHGVGMAEKGENLPVDGELLLYLDDIAYVQKP